VNVDVHATRQDILAGRINRLIALQPQSNKGDDAIFDADVGLIGLRSGDDGAVLDDQVHGTYIEIPVNIRNCKEGHRE